ncbi:MULTISPECIES: hypothetical protein [Halomonadaceae]|jgi:DNA-binding transcriptional regulator of glucitol operon|uniref:Uncharacterized protein n=1 Tax=Vreelandella neptunia TaxID=115551 RepID=A0ABZ0YTJ4_9GAMM|nr:MULTISPECIES: hypothetical protein [Halomonas]MDN3561655.1 hypothetical protein [Halomonas neptunia]TDV99508.1 hypothetical protein BDK62_102482 [Halomonas alkaliantarctica]WQH14557.1 hypothetical protein SR894_08470 [Halomonas neptunia]
MTINNSLKAMVAILLLTCLMLAWWGWQHMDAALLLMGTRLC